MTFPAGSASLRCPRDSEQGTSPERRKLECRFRQSVRLAEPEEASGRPLVCFLEVPVASRRPAQARTMLDKVRNIGIIAHVDAGKTTTTERILYFGGSKHKAGDVDEGNTTTDFDPLEKAKGITINSAAVTVEWNDTQITLIDTPGHVDFTAEVERSLRVLDGAIGVFCAVGGVEVQSETVWHQANKHKVPRVAFVNKLDRMGADFFDCIEQMKAKLSVTPAICTIPAGQSSTFEGVIDLVRMKMWDQ